MKYPILVCLLMLSLASAALCGRRLFASQEARQAAFKEYEECREIVDELRQLQHEPQRVAATPDIVEAVNDVLGSVDLPAQDISPPVVTALGKSGYTQQQVVITADAWQIGQLVRFLNTSKRQHPTLQPIAVSLNPNGINAASTTETWAVRITLTQFAASSITPSSTTPGL